MALCEYVFPLFYLFPFLYELPELLTLTVEFYSRIQLVILISIRF